MKQTPLTGSILNIVSDIDVGEDLHKPEGKSIASLLNDSKQSQEETETDTEQESGQ